MKLSIIIPLYNSEMSIAKCLTSLVYQNDGDYEIILIDDGSIDQSSTICNAFCLNDKNIRLINCKNSGPSKARNIGIRTAIGEYVLFVDSDDYVDNGHLLSYVQEIDKNKSDVIFSGFKFEDYETSQILNTISMNAGFYSKDDFPGIIRELIHNDMFGYTWCKAIKRSIINENRLQMDESISLHEDLLFSCEVCKCSHTLSVLPNSSYHYIKGNSGLCVKYRDNLCWLLDYVNEKYYDFLSFIKIEELEEEIIKRSSFSIFLVMKNEKANRWKVFSKQSLNKYRVFLNGITCSFIQNNQGVYKKVIHGKKKWICYFAVCSKCPMIFALMLLIYGAFSNLKK